MTKFIAMIANKCDDQNHFFNFTNVIIESFLQIKFRIENLSLVSSQKFN